MKHRSPVLGKGPAQQPLHTCWRGNTFGHSATHHETANTGTMMYWLLKAEPDSRVVKGKDVKVSPQYSACPCHQPRICQFSVDDFEAVGTSPWEGVRNYEARNLMREMHVGDKAGLL